MSSDIEKFSRAACFTLHLHMNTTLETGLHTFSYCFLDHSWMRTLFFTDLPIFPGVPETLLELGDLQKGPMFPRSVHHSLDLPGGGLQMHPKISRSILSSSDPLLNWLKSIWIHPPFPWSTGISSDPLWELQIHPEFLRSIQNWSYLPRDLRLLNKFLRFVEGLIQIHLWVPWIRPKISRDGPNS